ININITAISAPEMTYTPKNTPILSNILDKTAMSTTPYCLFVIRKEAKTASKRRQTQRNVSRKGFGRLFALSLGRQS
ncbi:MAG: hypothetical protein ACI3ZA_02975, partial [Alloprevotella sp.]